MFNFVCYFRAIFCFYNVIQEQLIGIIIIHDGQPRLGQEESQDQFYDAHDGFVIADEQICDADPDFEIKEHDLLQDESDDSQLSAVTEHEEEQEVEDEQEDEQEDELEDDEEDEEDDEEEHEEDDEEDQKKDEEQNDEQAEPEKWEDALEYFDVLPTFVDEEVDALQHFDAPVCKCSTAV